MIALALALAFGGAGVGAPEALRAAAPEPGAFQRAPGRERPAPLRTTVLDNATVTVTRLRFAPGSGEAVHTHDFPLVIVQLTGGDGVDLTSGGVTAASHASTARSGLNGAAGSTT